MTTYVDIVRPGYIERRPTPGRPVWTDYQWHATWVDATELARHRAIHREHIAVLNRFHLPHSPSTPATSPAYVDWRDTVATSRDLMAAARDGLLSTA